MSETTRVLRHRSELGSWELARRVPASQLRDVVCGYEGYVETGTPAPVLRQQVPTPRIPLIVNFGAAWNIGDAADGSSQRHDSFVAGLGERSSYVTASGPASCVQVNLTPLGAHMFFGVAMHELANAVVSLEDVLPHHTRDLAAKLENATSWESRFELLDTVFVTRLAEARAPSEDVAWAWSILQRTSGKAPIGWICDQLGRSRRHLATRFHEQIGLAPKTVARIFRFERAVELLGQRELGLATLAFECGYYDQAHLNRDFREFAGKPPGEFGSLIVPDGGVIVYITFVQDEAALVTIRSSETTEEDTMNCIAFMNYDDARAALDWLEHAFGFERAQVHEGPNGSIAHAELCFGDGMIMLGSAGKNDLGLKTPRELGAVNQGVYVIVDTGIDEHYERAVTAGAEVVRALHDTDYGSRDYVVRDPEGNLWSFGTYRPE